MRINLGATRLRRLVVVAAEVGGGGWQVFVRVRKREPGSSGQNLTVDSGGDRARQAGTCLQTPISRKPRTRAAPNPAAVSLRRGFRRARASPTHRGAPHGLGPPHCRAAIGRRRPSHLPLP